MQKRKKERKKLKGKANQQLSWAGNPGPLTHSSELAGAWEGTHSIPGLPEVLYLWRQSKCIQSAVNSWALSSYPHLVQMTVMLR